MLIDTRIISEGSCDTEAWSNNAENSALHQRNKLHFKILKKKIIVKGNNTLQNYCFSINAALVSIRDSLKNKQTNKKILQTPNF